MSVTNPTVICLLLVNLDGAAVYGFQQVIFYFFSSEVLWIKSGLMYWELLWELFHFWNDLGHFVIPLSTDTSPLPGFGERELDWEEDKNENNILCSSSLSFFGCFFNLFCFC